MGLQKNVASQKIAVYAYDTSADGPKTGDAANITAQISKDFGAAAATNDTNPTELDATDHPGIYVFDLTQAETDADNVLISAVSGTADVVLDPIQVFTVPPNFRELVVGGDGVVAADEVKISGDATAADNHEAYLDGSLFQPVDAHAPNFSVSGSTLTVKNPDGTTTAYTKTVTTDAGAAPITGAS